MSPPTQPSISGWVIICRLPHSNCHLFSAAGSRGIGWPSLLVFASHRPCTLMPLPRPPPLSNRLGHYLSASALKCCSMHIEKGDNVYLLSQAIINIIEQYRQYISLIICRLPHSVFHLFSAAGSRGIGWLSLLVFASHRPCTLLPLPRPPPLSNRLYHYLSATAQ